MPKFFNKRLFTQICIVYGIALVLKVAVLAIAKLNNISTGLLVDDPAAIMDYPVYVGMLSMVGILIWFATAAICLFSASILNPQTRQSKYWQHFIAVSGLISLGLAIDDLWMIHENYDVWLGLDRISLPLGRMSPGEFFESLIFGLYGAIVAAYLYYFRKIFKRTQMFALLAAIACFAFSVVIDITGEIFAIRHHHIPEEIFKMLGIVGWMFYFSLTCRQALQRLENPSITSPEVPNSPTAAFAYSESPQYSEVAPSTPEDRNT